MRNKLLAVFAALVMAGAAHAQSNNIFWFGYIGGDCTGYMITIYDEQVLEALLNSHIINSFRPVVWGRPMQCFKDIADSEGTH